MLSFFRKNVKRALLLFAFGFALLIFFIVSANAGIYFGTKKYIFESPAEAPNAQAAVIPGAAILKNGALSSIFRDRVDTAMELYRAGKVSKILVSGDNSTESHNEVNPVRNYLLESGIPDEDIFLDHAGFDTYSTMYRARDVFKVDSMIVSTQSFHLPRSVYLARHLGIEAYGVNADSGHILAKNYIREIFANVKAVLNIIFQRVPKYLGPEIPITGLPRR